jgi:hypothetical protein
MLVVQVDPLERCLARLVHLRLESRLNDFNVTAPPMAEEKTARLLGQPSQPLLQHDVQNSAREKNTSTAHSGGAQAGHASLRVGFVGFRSWV